MKRKTVILSSLIVVLLLAGLISCKQEPSSGKMQIPRWKKSESGLQNLPDVDVSGTGTGVTAALVNGIKNPPVFENANNLIVLVCEGLTTELINSSSEQYGELILKSFPTRGTTLSKFQSSTGTTLSDLMMKLPLLKTSTGLVVWGDASCSSMRRMASTKTNEASSESVCNGYITKDNPFLLVMGKGDFSVLSDSASTDYKNYVHKPRASVVRTLEDAIDVYNIVPLPGEPDPAPYLYSVFENEASQPSFRQETAFALAWLQKKMNDRGMCLISSYSAQNRTLDANAVRDFDEGVALAVKFVLENPDTALLVCGCPFDGSEEQVCFFGLGKEVSVKESLFECVSSLF